MSGSSPPAASTGPSWKRSTSRLLIEAHGDLECRDGVLDSREVAADEAFNERLGERAHRGLAHGEVGEVDPGRETPVHQLQVLEAAPELELGELAGQVLAGDAGLEQERRLVTAEKGLGALDADAGAPAHHLLLWQRRVQDLARHSLVHADRDLVGGDELAALGLGEESLQAHELLLEKLLLHLCSCRVRRLAQAAGGCGRENGEGQKGGSRTRAEHWTSWLIGLSPPVKRRHSGVSWKTAQTGRWSLASLTSRATPASASVKGRPLTKT